MSDKLIIPGFHSLFFKFLSILPETNMSFRFCLLATIIALLFLTSCSSGNGDESKKMQEIVFDDGYKTNPNNEIVIEDKIFLKEDVVSTVKESSQGTTRTLDDNSNVTVEYDGYGNKTETRTFANDERLKFVMLRTSADGKKQVFVYGQNGKVNRLPEEIVDNAMISPAKEIANAAGILEGRRPKIKNIYIQNTKPLQPLPSSKFPIQAPQNIQPQTEEDEQNINESKADEKSSDLAKSKEITLRNRQPDKEK